MINPCCCLSPQTAIFLLAGFDAGINGIALLSVLIHVVETVLNARIHTGEEGKEETRDISSCGLIVFKCIFEILVAAYLLQSAQKKSYRGCRRWIIGITVMSVIGVALDVLQYYISPKPITVIEICVHVGLVVYTMFEVWVVLIFMKAIKPKTTKPYQNFRTEGRVETSRA